ncbi:hypothetical protein GIB67_011433 [Kingdonia uniflora]|uniref:Reverse transcriptase zinc-binding domain-containing protein n=1 Tax=Kingdonia uniflora TaxID=39325 RepID=A0A7J7NM80_9MAGN|nr:hypothetical protein GIB67_011433 [Kingdonia uniflora]
MNWFVFGFLRAIDNSRFVVGHIVSECRDVEKAIEIEKVIHNEADKEPKKKRRNRKKPNKNDQKEKEKENQKKDGKLKEVIVDKTPSTQPTSMNKTYKGVAEMWDKTTQEWDGSSNSREVDREACMVNQSWAYMVEEGDGTSLITDEGVEIEDNSGSESNSETCSNTDTGFSDEVVYQTQEAEEWHNVLSRKNIRKNKGIANSNTSYCLKNLMIKHSPDLLCIAEPKVLPDAKNLRRLSMHSMDREMLFFDNGLSFPNIWVFWHKGLSTPTVLASCKQHITVLVENVIVSFVHADCSYIRRRDLWKDLSVFGTSNLSWLVVGDFNVVLRGGINLRRLKEINQSLMMKLAWNFLNPKDEWAEFMPAKFITKSGNFSTITKGSSIWAGVRGALEDVSSHSGWVIGDGKCINLWRDNWYSPLSLKDMINDDAIPWTDLNAKVSYIISEGRWSIPYNLQLIFDRFGVDIHSIKINHHKPDRRVWKPDLIGKFSTKGAFETIRNKGQQNWWFKFFFRSAIHPRLSMWGWRLCHGKLPTDDNVQKKGITLASRCCLCANNSKSIHHLFWDCSFSNWLWTWLEDLFQV